MKRYNTGQVTLAAKGNIIVIWLLLALIITPHNVRSVIRNYIAQIKGIFDCSISLHMYQGIFTGGLNQVGETIYVGVAEISDVSSWSQRHLSTRGDHKRTRKGLHKSHIPHESITPLMTLIDSSLGATHVSNMDSTQDNTYNYYNINMKRCIIKDTSVQDNIGRGKHSDHHTLNNQGIYAYEDRDYKDIIEDEDEGAAKGEEEVTGHNINSYTSEGIIMDSTIDQVNYLLTISPLRLRLG